MAMLVITRWYMYDMKRKWMTRAFPSSSADRRARFAASFKLWLSMISCKFRENLNRKSWFLPLNIGLSCKFSHHPILWMPPPKKCESTIDLNGNLNHRDWFWHHCFCTDIPILLSSTFLLQKKTQSAKKNTG